MTELNDVFAGLRALMAPCAASLDVKKDDSRELYLDTWHVQKNKKPLFFGAVQVKKSFVSYHLMPVYTQPDLLEGLSPALKARMQGKSCFNFKAIDPELFEELGLLTQRAFDSWVAQGLVQPPAGAA